MFKDAAEDLVPGKWRGVEGPTLHGVTVDPAFNDAVDLIEEHRLRTGPATPHPAEQRRDEEKRETHSGDDEEQQPQILRREREAEEVETALGEVEKDGRVAVDLDPRQREVEDDQRIRRYPARASEPAVSVRWKQERPRPVGANRRDSVTVRKIENGCGHGGRRRQGTKCGGRALVRMLKKKSAPSAARGSAGRGGKNQVQR